MDKCNCELCTDFRRIDGVIKRENFAELIGEVKALRDKWFYADDDNNRYKAILDGTWPSAREILTAALAKCPVEEVSV